VPGGGQQSFLEDPSMTRHRIGLGVLLGIALLTEPALASHVTAARGRPADFAPGD